MILVLAFLTLLGIIEPVPKATVEYTPVKLAIFVETPSGTTNIPWMQNFKTMKECETNATLIYNVLTSEPGPVQGIQMMACYVPDSINI